jgi:hypothetical protein
MEIKFSTYSVSTLLGKEFFVEYVPDKKHSRKRRALDKESDFDSECGYHLPISDSPAI